MSAEDVRKLHSPFKLYEECAHTSDEDGAEFHEDRDVVYIEDLGYTCADPIQTVCFECDTDDGAPNENTEYGEFPCATLKALELP